MTSWCEIEKNIKFTFLRHIKVVDSIITQQLSSLVFSLGVNFMKNM